MVKCGARSWGCATTRRCSRTISSHTALLNTIAFSALAVTITLLLAFFIGALLRSIERAAPVFELLFYIPVVMPGCRRR